MADKLIIDCFTGELIERDYTDEDKAIIERQKRDLVIITEPVDEEKAILAEAVISLTDEIEQLKARIQTLEGGI